MNKVAAVDLQLRAQYRSPSLSQIVLNPEGAAALAAPSTILPNCHHEEGFSPTRDLLFFLASE